jgi:microcystin-dependent protein
MAQPYVGEIRMFAGSFAPAGWMFCSGQLLPISENETLFQLIGTTYGGDGESTFALPNLQSRVPMHQGQGAGLPNNYILAESGGVETVTLTTQQIPIHTHPAMCHAGAGGATSAVPTNAVWNDSDVTQYTSLAPSGNMNAAALVGQGGSQPHENESPFLCINYIISLFGIFPSPT